MKIFVQKSPNLNCWGDSEGIKQYLIVFVCKIGGGREKESDRGGIKRKIKKGKEVVLSHMLASIFHLLLMVV
jgi:hypothetical protein